MSDEWLQPIKLGGFIHHKQWNTVRRRMLAKSEAKHLNEMRRYPFPVVVEATADLAPFSVFGITGSSSLTRGRVNLNSGLQGHWLTNGPITIPVNSKGMANFISDRCRLRYEGDAPAVGSICGAYKGAIHKDLVGFVCLSAPDEDDLIWVLKCNDQAMNVRTAGSITARSESTLGTGQATVLDRSNGGATLSLGSNLDVLNANDNLILSGEYAKALPVDSVGLVVAGPCEEAEGSCSTTINLVQSITERTLQDLILSDVTNVDLTYLQGQRCLSEGNETTKILDNCCYDCDKLDCSEEFQGLMDATSMDYNTHGDTVRFFGFGNSQAYNPAITDHTNQLVFNNGELEWKEYKPSGFTPFRWVSESVCRSRLDAVRRYSFDFLIDQFRNGHTPGGQITGSFPLAWRVRGAGFGGSQVLTFEIDYNSSIVYTQIINPLQWYSLLFEVNGIRVVGKSEMKAFVDGTEVYDAGNTVSGSPICGDDASMFITGGQNSASAGSDTYFKVRNVIITF